MESGGVWQTRRMLSSCQGEWSRGGPTDVGCGRAREWRGACAGVDVAGPGAVGGGGWLAGGGNEAPGAGGLGAHGIRGGCVGLGFVWTRFFVEVGV
jgi:hypothetical protein